MSHNLTILENCEEDQHLPDDQEPVAFWTIVLLFINITVKNKRYLVLEKLPSLVDRNRYSDVSETNFAESYWTTPYIGRGLSDFSSEQTHTSVSRILKRFDEVDLASKDIEDAITNKLYHMGISSADYKMIDRFTEHKPSPRRQGEFKCYRIHAYSISGIHTASPMSIQNIADPEGLYCYRYLPLNGATGNDETPLFLNRLIQSNVQQVVNNHLLHGANKSLGSDVPLEDFVSNERGIVFKLDIGGYGETAKMLEKELRTPLSDGHQTFLDWERNMGSAITSVLSEYNVTQTQILGDGFIAGIPGPVIRKLDIDPLALIVDIADNISSRILSLFEGGPISIRIRVGITKGCYRFGRLGGPTDNFPRPIGQPLVIATRLESAIKGFSEFNEFARHNEQELEESSGGLSFIYLCYDDSMNEYSNENNSNLFSSSNSKRAVIKEFDEDVTLCLRKKPS